MYAEPQFVISCCDVLCKFLREKNVHTAIQFCILLREYDEQKEAILDHSCTSNVTSICKPALLHAR